MSYSGRAGRAGNGGRSGHQPGPQRDNTDPDGDQGGAEWNTVGRRKKGRAALPTEAVSGAGTGGAGGGGARGSTTGGAWGGGARGSATRGVTGGTRGSATASTRGSLRGGTQGTIGRASVASPGALSQTPQGPLPVSTQRTGSLPTTHAGHSHGQGPMGAWGRREPLASSATNALHPQAWGGVRNTKTGDRSIDAGLAAGQPPVSTRVAKPGDPPGHIIQSSNTAKHVQDSQENRPTVNDTQGPNDLPKHDQDTGTHLLPIRPSFGTAGRMAKIDANYFKLGFEKNPRAIYYEYSVRLSPDPQNRAKSRSVFESMLETSEFRKLVSNRNTIATDKMGTIISSRKLNLQLMTDGPTYEFPLQPNQSTDNVANSPNHISYMVQISLVRELHVSELLEYVLKQKQHYDVLPIIRALNIILTSTLPREDQSHIFNIGQKRYSLKESFPLDPEIEAYCGYFSSVVASHGAVFCNVNVCMTAFFKPHNLGELMTNKFFERKFFKGVKVETTYMGSKKIFRIDGITDSGQSASRLGFFWQEYNKNITVQEYFKRQYNYNLKRPDLPCVIKKVPGNKMAYIPAECCTVSAKQIFRATLTPTATKKMLNAACQTPGVNKKKIQESGLDILGFKVPEDVNCVLNNFQLKIEQTLQETQSRVLTLPNLRYCSNKKGPTQAKPIKGVQPESTQANWNLRDVHFIDSAAIGDSWAVLQIGSFAPTPTLLEAFQTTCNNQGIKINPISLSRIHCVPLPQASPKNLEQYLNQAMRPISDSIKKIAGQKVKLLLVVLPSVDKDIYSLVRYLVDCKHGVHTVCCQREHIQKGDRRYLANLAMKVNIKAGGRTHELDSQVGAQALALLGEDSLILGADVAHPATGDAPDSTLPSIAAVVGSYEGSYTLYPGSLRLQKSKQEMIEHLGEQIQERLRLYLKHNNNVPPKKLWYFRDGVSNGQFHQVNSQELPKIQDACRQVVGEGYTPKIVIIVCGKRHHTRFYARGNDREFSYKGNCVPGTVVDNTITSLYNYDFYLQAHGALRGTARPGHYTVTHDDLNLEPNQVQNLVLCLSFIFARATTGVSLVSPAYYADLLCERGLRYLRVLSADAVDAAVRIQHNRAPQTQDSRDSRAQRKAQKDAMEVEIMAQLQARWGNLPHSAVSDTMFYL